MRLDFECERVKKKKTTEAQTAVSQQVKILPAGICYQKQALVTAGENNRTETSVSLAVVGTLSLWLCRFGGVSLGDGITGDEG